MKKFKYLIFLLSCALYVFAAFAFAGCKDTSGYYVKDSFTYKISSTYTTIYTVNGSFKINVPGAGKYTVKYTLTTYGEETQSVTGSEELAVEKSGEQTVEVSHIFDKIQSKAASTAEITKVTITKKIANGDSVNYAIGFGTAGGVVLIGLIVVFALDKTGVLYKRK